MTTDREKAKIKAIGALFIPGAFPRQEQEGTERQLLQIYLMAVEDIPSDFVAMACKRFIQGQVMRQNYTFRPMPPELAIEARRLRDKALDNNRLASLRLPKPELHEPPDPTPEERQRCAEMWAKAKAEIGAAADTGWGEKRAWKSPSREELAASRDRIAAYTARHKGEAA